MQHATLTTVSTPGKRQSEGYGAGNRGAYLADVCVGKPRKFRKLVRSAPALRRQHDDAERSQRDAGSQYRPRICAGGMGDADECRHGQYNARHDESPPKNAHARQDHACATEVKSDEGRCSR